MRVKRDVNLLYLKMHHGLTQRGVGALIQKSKILCPSPVFQAPQGCGPPSLPRLGAVDFPSAAGEEEQRVLEGVMFRLRERVGHRRVLAKPCFQDFDK